jgi:hypothetical protein
VVQVPCFAQQPCPTESGEDVHAEQQWAVHCRSCKHPPLLQRSCVKNFVDHSSGNGTGWQLVH